MNPVLKLLLEGASLDTAQMAQVLNLSEAEVNRQLGELKTQRVLLGWAPTASAGKPRDPVIHHPPARATCWG